MIQLKIFCLLSRIKGKKISVVSCMTSRSRKLRALISRNVANCCMNMLGYHTQIGLQSTCAGTGGSRCSPSKIMGRANNTSCSPKFFCNLQLKCKLLTQKFSKTPGFWGLCLRPHCTRYIPFSKNTYCIKLHIMNMIVLIFLPISAPTNQKIVPTVPALRNKVRCCDCSFNFVVSWSCSGPRSPALLNGCQGEWRRL